MSVGKKSVTGWRYLAIGLGLALAQTAVLGSMVENRANLLRSGQEIVLKTAPVDPRDLLRGDYVILAYDISTIPVSRITGPRPAQAGWQSMWVRVRPGADGYWVVDEASFGPLGAQQGSVVLQTQRFRYFGAADLTAEGAASLRVDYGIERFYVPEGEGGAIETARNDGEVSVAVRVGEGGQSQIRELRIDGEPLFQEALY
ncbi:MULTISPECIES: GDYXXLXY domain-containing protein [Alphaproteobacteria]|uniref:Membrane protein n=2 Tax=Alphaproteobacteria TaxID=28211 RepID=A0A512HHN9_9HYPH|nr:MULTISPECIES: GDYXXLXY domain-containing protein [Alphaproteobacteria]GEO84900.1 membrane protein [Ciceribacter naphthalenivorans]GLR22834.1 membrane protein [Ciceribacter naphthalenivorans]GLT05690.1 membrane protein [Sphingomonas psychrolutea]